MDLTPAALKRLIRAYEDFVPMSLLVDRFGGSQQSIREQLANAGIPPRPRTAEAD